MHAHTNMCMHIYPHQPIYHLLSRDILG